MSPLERHLKGLKFVYQISQVSKMDLIKAGHKDKAMDLLMTQRIYSKLVKHKIFIMGLLPNYLLTTF